MIWYADIEKLALRPMNCPPVNSKPIQYGTAGFRDKGDSLHHIVFRMGILAALRSQYLGKAVGLMITASHNPHEDNGVKIVDPDGEMLAADWEIIATDIANSVDVAGAVAKVVNSHKINASVVNPVFPLIVVGRDTRPSSVDLWKAAVEGISEAMKFPLIDCGIVTTPQLHYVVKKLNEDFPPENVEKLVSIPSSTLSTIYLNKYFQEVCDSFLAHAAIIAARKQLILPKALHVDCANGVGVFALTSAAARLSKILNLIPVNTDHQNPNKLNFQCGADYVKVQQTAPASVDFVPGNCYASFDGDADRLVYYFKDKSLGSFHLLDGDKIATLYAAYLAELLVAAKLKDTLSMGLIQTAYANGSSTTYICQELKIPVVCVSTGVKHLHKAALKFDIGVYFEANGHGTVVFSEKACEVLSKKATATNEAPAVFEASQKLNHMRLIINPAVGDALTDLLAVEAILLDRDWLLEDWNACYTDLPSRQLKVKVKDRFAITNEDAERRVVTPATLQPAIDDLVEKVPRGRSFVRPSGTEDIVRIYAEAETQAHADWLAYDVAMVSFNLAGGVAPEPAKPNMERPTN